MTTQAVSEFQESFVMADFYVVAQYESIDDANVGLQVLDKLGLEHDAISLVTRTPLIETPDSRATSVENGTRDIELHQDDNESSVADRLSSPTASQAAAGAGAGAVLATGLALPLAVSTAVAPFFIAGPMFAAVLGTIGGAAVGAGQSDRTDQSNHYRNLVESGSTLVIFSGNRSMALEAVRGLKTTHAKEVELIDRTV